MDFAFELAHIGINCPNADEADKVAQAFDDLFGFTKKVGSSSIFAGTAIEAMKTNYLGANGHIAIKAAHIEEAKKYLEEKGYEFDETTAKFKPDGSLNAIYLKGEFGGFAIHLLAK